VGYYSEDLIILEQMIKDNAKVPLIDYYGKKQVILKETQGTNYEVTILDIPEETLIIQSDLFEAPKSIFNNSKGECKRSDFIVISDQDNLKIIMFIEMKVGKANTQEIIQQLKGSECLISYCREIGKKFWNQINFLENYEYRFISMKHINIAKRCTREKQLPTIHNSPENMLKIYAPKEIQFNKLIGK
jgi:hypothetical protein